MRYNRLGRTGIEASEVGLGAWQLGALENERDAFRLLDKAIDLGITFIDTAAGYGESEVYIGKWLKARQPEVAIATKISCRPDWTLDEMRAAVDQSLRRLQLDTVDMIKIHSPGLEVIQRGEAYQVLAEAKAAGKIRWTAISQDHQDAQACLEHSPFDVLQVDYSMVTRGPEDSLFVYMREQDIGAIARMVFARFVYRRTPQYDWERPMRDRAREMRLTDWFARHPSYTEPELLLRYALSNPDLHCALVGTANPDHLAENVAQAEKGPLPDDVLADFRTWVEQGGESA